jgi:hypothetical protein
MEASLALNDVHPKPNMCDRPWIDLPFGYGFGVETLPPLVGHTLAANSMAFPPDGTLLLHMI